MYVNNNCLRRLVKKAGISPIGKKIGTTRNLQVLGIFLSKARLGTGASCARAITIYKFHKFTFAHVTNIVAKTPKKQFVTSTVRKNPLATTLSL